jgi:serine/threonine-protein kinase
MSPEQCRGRDIGPQSDIYSLGVILHQMFAGAPPFVAESFYEVISAHMTKVPPPLRSVADVPAELEAVVTRCLAKERADRFSTVRELSDALLPVLQQLAGSAVGAPAQLRPAPSLASMASVHEGPAAPPPAKSRTGLYIGLAAGLVVVGGVVAGVGLTRPAPVLAPASAPAVATPPTGPVEPAAPRLVTIQFMVSPPDAKWEIFVDGKKHDKLEIETPMSRTTSFEVKIVAPGYQPFIANPRPLTDLVIPVNLLKVGEAPKAGPRRPAATGGKAPAPAAPEKPAAPRVNRIQDI